MTDQEIQTIGTLRIDHQQRLVGREGYAIKLSPKEFAILSILVSHHGNPVSREQIFVELGKATKKESPSNLIDVYIASIRRKTEIKGFARIIHTVRNQGYVFRTNSNENETI